MATTTTGPNDASGVVWALGVFFYLFLRDLLFILLQCTPADPRLRISTPSHALRPQPRVLTPATHFNPPATCFHPQPCVLTPQLPISTPQLPVLTRFNIHQFFPAPPGPKMRIRAIICTFLHLFSLFGSGNDVLDVVMALYVRHTYITAYSSVLEYV